MQARSRHLEGTILDWERRGGLDCRCPRTFETMSEVKLSLWVTTLIREPQLGPIYPIVMNHAGRTLPHLLLIGHSRSQNLPVIAYFLTVVLRVDLVDRWPRSKRLGDPVYGWNTCGQPWYLDSKPSVSSSRSGSLLSF